jgi:hypothetical protein
MLSGIADADGADFMADLEDFFFDTNLEDLWGDDDTPMSTIL